MDVAMLRCSKIRYPTQSSAEMALRAIQRKSRARGRKAPTGSYWCNACRFWHLSSKSPSRRAPWAKRPWADVTWDGRCFRDAGDHSVGVSAVDGVARQRAQDEPAFGSFSAAGL